MFVHKLSGRCTYHIDTEDYGVQPGDVILINPGVSM
jgi:quercetin dioxygenase-like cupin family protein